MSLTGGVSKHRISKITPTVQFHLFPQLRLPGPGSGQEGSSALSGSSQPPGSEEVTEGFSSRGGDELLYTKARRGQEPQQAVMTPTNTVWSLQSVGAVQLWKQWAHVCVNTETLRTTSS